MPAAKCSQHTYTRTCSAGATMNSNRREGPQLQPQPQPRCLSPGARRWNLSANSERASDQLRNQRSSPTPKRAGAPRSDPDQSNAIAWRASLVDGAHLQIEGPLQPRGRAGFTHTNSGRGATVEDTNKNKLSKSDWPTGPIDGSRVGGANLCAVLHSTRACSMAAPIARENSDTPFE